jgi:hypothetical protein
MKLRNRGIIGMLLPGKSPRFFKMETPLLVSQIHFRSSASWNLYIDLRYQTRSRSLLPKTKQFDAALADLSFPFSDSTKIQSPDTYLEAAEALYALGRFKECMELVNNFYKWHPTCFEAQIK